MQNDLRVELVYYRLCGKNIFKAHIEKAELLSKIGEKISDDLLCDISIKENNKSFLHELEKNIIPNGYEYMDYWLRGLISDYVKRKSVENGDTPYYAEYYVSWINNTRLVISNQYPVIQKWCDEYEKLIVNNTTNNIMETNNKNIFIVHGHDKEMKLEVKDYVSSDLDLNPIVLNDLPNQGRTIIEKFEFYSKTTEFAIILLSPDDIGGKGIDSLQKRARQNVLFEFGYFVSMLGRDKVFALLKDEVEKPSDIDGVLYIPFNNDWKFNLLKELKNAGAPV